MLTWRGLDEIPDGFGPSVITLGNFDGVHRGHQGVLAGVVRAARARGAAAVAITFDPHPIQVLHPERAPALLTGLEQRLALLAETGLDATLAVHFTAEFALLTPEEFIRQYFVDPLGAVAVVVGRDTRFGVHNSGDFSTLQELGERLGFEVLATEEIGGPVTEAQAAESEQSARPTRAWSSTYVRHVLESGDVDLAAEILGRDHAVRGTVVHGKHRGRELGYPTANLGADAVGLPPAPGVYAGWLVRHDLPASDPQHRLPAAISTGTNPTFDDVRVRTVEAYVLDRLDLDLYGEDVSVEFTHRLRGNVAFESIEALIDQMGRDVDTARELLAP